MKYKQIGVIEIALGLALTVPFARSALSITSDRPNTSPPQLNNSVSQTASLTYSLETYRSSVMGGVRQYGVCLPPDYQQNSLKRYPVVFLLHGGNGDPTDWFQKQKGNALVTLQKLYETNKLSPSIIITPDGNDLRGKSRTSDPQYFDSANGKVSTAIGDELVKIIQTRYRTLPTPNFWAIGGLSSGAWGAVNIGLHHLNHFSILFSHSGYFTDKSGAQNSPLNLVKNLTPSQRQQLRIYLDTGTADSFYLDQNQQFSRELNRLKILNVFRQFPGSHSWRYWRTHLADSLTFVGKQWQTESSSSL